MYKEGSNTRVMATFSFPLAKTAQEQARIKLMAGSDPQLANLDPNAVLADMFLFGIEIYEGEHTDDWVADMTSAIGRTLVPDLSDPTGGREGLSDPDFIVILIERIREALPMGYARRITGHINGNRSQGGIAAFDDPLPPFELPVKGPGH